MATPLDSLAQYIAVDLGIGALGTTTFEDNMPDDVSGKYDTAVCVVGQPGGPPDLSTNGSNDFPGFLIFSRAIDAGTATTNIYTIFQGLHGLHEQTIHGTYFNLIAALHSIPMSLGRDERQRFVYSWAFRSMVVGVTR